MGTMAWKVGKAKKKKKGKPICRYNSKVVCHQILELMIVLQAHSLIQFTPLSVYIIYIIDKLHENVEWNSVPPQIWERKKILSGNNLTPKNPKKLYQPFFFFENKKYSKKLQN